MHNSLAIPLSHRRQRSGGGWGGGVNTSKIIYYLAYGERAEFVFLKSDVRLHKHEYSITVSEKYVVTKTSLGRIPL